MTTGLDVVRLLGLGLSALLLRCARGSLIHNTKWVKNETISDGKESGRGERREEVGMSRSRQGRVSRSDVCGTTHDDQRDQSKWIRISSSRLFHVGTFIIATYITT